MSDDVRQPACPAENCPRCALIALALFSAVAEGVRAPDRATALARTLCSPWMLVPAEVTDRQLELMCDQGHFIVQMDGLHLTRAGRARLLALMTLPVDGLSPLAMALSVLRLTALSYLPPMERARVREQIRQGWHQGASILRRAAQQQEAGDLLHSFLAAQVQVLESLGQALSRPLALPMAEA